MGVFRQATFYLAELFHQATFYLAELFCQATFYLAELFRQATFYLAELFCQIAFQFNLNSNVFFSDVSINPLSTLILFPFFVQKLSTFLNIISKIYDQALKNYANIGLQVFI